jgi:hypothetical protein
MAFVVEKGETVPEEEGHGEGGEEAQPPVSPGRRRPLLRL